MSPRCPRTDERRGEFSIEVAVDARAACPYCGQQLLRDHVIAPAAERSVTPSTSRSGSVSRNGSVTLPETSAKTAALIQLLKASEPGVKSLVFSQVRCSYDSQVEASLADVLIPRQWTGHLDRIEAALNEEGITTCR